MTSPAGRLLRLLELLQSGPLVTGREIADRLSIDRRTVRRDVAALQALGIPIEGERGIGGGYRLRPGYRLPPLMFSDEEAIAVAFGLIAAERQGLGSAEAALAKILRVLPEVLRRRVQALEHTTSVTTRRPGAPVPNAGTNALTLAAAIRRRRRIEVGYTTFAGDTRERLLSPYGLVVHDARWYLSAHDHMRDDLRTFRVDRIARVRTLRDQAASPPEGFDPAEHVSRSLARVPYRWEVHVVLELAESDAAGRVPRTLAELEPDGDRTHLRMRADSLDWAAAFLAGLGCDFTVVTPDELRAPLEQVAARLERIATRR
jgi:predicted DNA-binding transcriptional regulator YafY